MNEEKKPKKKQILFKKDHLQNHPHAKWLNTAIRSNRWGKEKKVKLTYKKLNGDTVERQVKPLGTRGDHLIAHDFMRDGVRSFHIGRIEKMEKSALSLESTVNYPFFIGFANRATRAEGE
jgi:predicted DNA-binding transcriptional regulator YafY